jgi:hypothetical protein
VARNPFEFLDQGSRERVLLVLLLALIRKGGGELELSIQDLTAINEGDSFIKYPADSGTSLVLRFARKGAEAYFLSETTSTTASSPSPRSSSSMRPMPPDSLPPPSQTLPPSSLPSRHAVHDDLDYALREEEIAARTAAAAKRRLDQAKAQAQTLPWRTVKPQ